MPCYFEDMIRVFVIEDNESDRLLIRQHLEATGDFEIVGEARYVGDAFRGVQETEPDVITLDEFLPTVKGTTLISGLRLHVGSTPIVGFTGSIDPTGLSKAGADDALGKWQIEQLSDRLRKAVQRHESRRRMDQGLHQPRHNDDASFEEAITRVKEARVGRHQGNQ
jgi:DNA-binding NarL/FixJ family response regulator